VREPDRELTHLVGGVAIVLAGDMPAEHPARGEGSATIRLRLETHAQSAPLRPAGTPVLEVDSWAAFLDDDRATLCIKDSAATPLEVVRFELPRNGLDGHAYYRPDAPPRPFAYPADQLLTIHALSVGGGALAHAASIVGRDGAFLVAGPSGAGKSTMSRACSELGGRVLSDERTVVRPRSAGSRGADGWALGGTPWPGEGGFAHNASAPLRGLVFLEQADREELVPISPARALALLYRCHFPPLWDDKAAARVLDHLERLVQDVPRFVFHNRKGPAAARLLLDRLGGPLAGTP
jgi:hypothetical protein